MYLPCEIVRKIVGYADVSIDTKRYFGVYTKLVVNSKLVDLLSSVNNNKRQLIKNDNTTITVIKNGHGCKLREYHLRINRYSNYDIFVLRKDYYKSNTITLYKWVFF